MISEKKIHQWLESGLMKRQGKSFNQMRNLKDIKTAEQNIPIDEEAVYTFANLSMPRQEGPLCSSMDIVQMTEGSIKPRLNLPA
jgi:hypothetical protein